MNWLESGEILASIGEFLAEDIGRGDITTTATVPADTRGVGKFLAKEDLVLCGLDVVAFVASLREHSRYVTAALSAQGKTVWPRSPSLTGTLSALHVPSPLFTPVTPFT